MPGPGASWRRISFTIAIDRGETGSSPAWRRPRKSTCSSGEMRRDELEPEAVDPARDVLVAVAEGRDPLLHPVGAHPSRQLLVVPDDRLLHGRAQVVVAVPLLPGAAHAVPGQHEGRVGDDARLEPDQGVRDLERGARRRARGRLGGAVAHGSARPHVPHDEGGAEAREELPEIALRVGGGSRRGRQGERDDGDGEIRPSPREHTRSGPSGGLPRAPVKVESTRGIGPAPGNSFSLRSHNS